MQKKYTDAMDGLKFQDDARKLYEEMKVFFVPKTQEQEIAEALAGAPASQHYGFFTGSALHIDVAV